MRITQKMMTNKVNGGLSKNVEKLMTTQSRISSGKQFTKASEDPIGMTKVLDYRKTLASVDQYVRNISHARSGLDNGEATLSDIGELLNQARELALSQTTGTASPETRQVAAVEVRQLRDQMIQLANTKQDDRYMFGGRKADAPPYDPLHPELGFQGDDGGFSVIVGDGVTLDTAVSGKQAFGSLADPVLVLTDLINGMEANDPSAISAQLDPLDQSLAQITNERADVGARLNRLDATESHWDVFKINVEQMLSNTEDVDLTQAIMDLTAQQSAFQASLASASKIIQPSLLDYLR
jgi:flagellar hook-associated protein 3 FlgL